MGKPITREDKLKTIKSFVYNLLYSNLSQQMNRSPEIVFDNDSIPANIKSPREAECKKIKGISRNFVESLKKEKSRKIRNADINYFYEEAKDECKKNNSFVLFIFLLCLSPVLAWLISKFSSSSITALVGIITVLISILGMLFNTSNEKNTHLHKRFWLWYETRNDGKMKS